MDTQENLFPRDFSDLQLGRGYVFTLFCKGERILTELFYGKIAELKERLKRIEQEQLVSSRELNVVIGDKRATAQKMIDYTKRAAELQRINDEVKEREPIIDDIINNRKLGIESEIDLLESQIATTKNKSLKNLITRENIETIFSVTGTNDIGIVSDFKDVRGNPYFSMLKYLIRNGYIDETYADYITYFYAESLSREDKIFLRSVSDQLEKGPRYNLKDPAKVFKRMNEVVFDQPEVMNYDLLIYLLKQCSREAVKSQKDQNGMDDNNGFPFFSCTDFVDLKEAKCLEKMMEQAISDSDLAFIQGAFQVIQCKDRNYLVNYLNAEHKDVLKDILSHKTAFADALIDEYVFRTLVGTPQSDLISDDSFRAALSKYISEHASFLGSALYRDDHLMAAFDVDFAFLMKRNYLVNRMKALVVYFVALDSTDANVQVFDAIYEAGLYALNYANIAHLLEVKYELQKNEDFIHKNYTLIRSVPDSFLMACVENNIDNYLEIILAECNSKICDDVAAALAILNNTTASSENKAAYIKVLNTTLPTITDFADKNLWQQLVVENCLAHDERNVLEYYMHCDGLNAELVMYVNSEGNTYDFSAICSDYEDVIQSSFFDAVIRCNDLSNTHYGQILKTLNRVYSNGFSVEDINDDKVLLLVDLGIIKMHIGALQFLREHYEGAVVPYIIKNLDAYLSEVLDDDTYDLNELKAILAQNIADKSKLTVLASISEEVTANEKHYSDAVKAHILLHNLKESDIKLFARSYPCEGNLTKAAIEEIVKANIDFIFENTLHMDKTLASVVINASTVTQDDKMKVFATLLPDLNEQQCREYLRHLGLHDYLSLFERKRPKITIHDVSTRILDIFREKGWINTYEEDSSNPDYYRAYGRKGKDETT